MASQSVIAEGNGTVSSDQINYKQKLFSHPTYRYQPQFSNTFGQSVNLGSSQTPVTINVPPTVFNMSQSYIAYTVFLPAVTNRYIWYARQALKEISHIQWYAGSNMYIADIDNLQNYLDIVMKKEIEAEEFMALSELTGVSISNSLVTMIPSLRNSNTTTTNTPGLATNPSSVNYNEPGYFNVGALGQPVSYTVQFPLRYIKNSAFSVDKNMYFAQTTYLKVYFGPISKICYTSDSNDNPSAGAKLSYVPSAGNATIGGPITVAVPPYNTQPIQLQLLLAVESNEDLKTIIMNQVTSSGLSYSIPYVQAFKNNNQGATQTISINVDQNNGQKLLKVYHAPYNSNEDQDTMYDHANNATVAGLTDGTGAAGAINQKVIQYYTQLNGARIQDLTLDCTPFGPFTDYMSHRKQLRGSIISNSNVFQYNWFHCDDWSEFGPKYDQDNKGELVAGIPLTVSQLTWSFNGSQMRSGVNLINGLVNNNFNHYSWFVFVKRLSMSPGTITVQ